jgi:FkbM family methyltransferase
LNVRRVFDEPHYDRINSARGDAVVRVLGDLSGSLQLHTAVDVGCGLGYFSNFLQERGLVVTGVDGRDENASEAARRYAQVRFVTANVEDVGEMAKLGTFDLAICLGLLYHLENPFRAIRNLYGLTGQLLLVESMCAPGLNPSMELLDEFQTEDQGLNYVAFYPTEACLVKMLYRAGFRFVYAVTPLPEHPDFRVTRSRKKARSMLAASRAPLVTTILTLLHEPQRPWDIWSTRNSWPARFRHLVTRSVRWRSATGVNSLRPQADTFERRTVGNEIWIDVGAHCGQTTLQSALENPKLRVYALEPNLAAAAKLVGRSANFFVAPMAVSERNGIGKLYVNSCEAASSMLPMDDCARRDWTGGEDLRVNSIVTVPTIRLDTFMDMLGIDRVDYLKIDTQGMDLAVVRSAGDRLADIGKITLEVDIKPTRLYSGAASKEEIVAFLTKAGFYLAGVERQTHGQEENLTFIR